MNVIRVFLLCVILVSGAFASDLPYYNSENEPFWWNRNRLAVTQVQVTEMPVTENMTLRVHFRVVDKNGNSYLSADADYAFSSGAFVGQANLPTPSWWFDPRFNLPGLAPYTLEITGVTRMGFGPWGGEVTLIGDKTITMTNLGDYPGTRPSSAITDYFTNATVVFGPYDECPPRDLAFKLGLLIQAAAIDSHNVAVSLVINDGAPFELVPPYIAKGEVTLNLTANIPAVPGAFTYKWYLNNKVVAQGMYGCGDEIPFDTVSDLGTAEADPLEDTDRDGDPDITDPDVDGDGTPNGEDDDWQPPTKPPTGTNADPGAPAGSAGTPTTPPGSVKPQPGDATGTPGENGNVRVLNMKDFGEQFKWALENAGNNNGYFPAPGNGTNPGGAGMGWTDPSPGELSTAPIDAAAEALGDAEHEANLLRGEIDGVPLAFASHKPVVTGTPSSEGKWVFQIGQYGQRLFGVTSFEVDLTPYANAIGPFRKLLSWILMVIAWFKFWNYFRGVFPA